jgi:hypothetical protein
MKLLDNHLDNLSLSKFGEEACRFFIARDFSELANRFGYAFAYNQDPASAIEVDFDHCLSGRSASLASIESVTVKNFNTNNTGLVSVIECILLFDKSLRILIELIVAKKGEAHYIYLEDINMVPPTRVDGAI